jgi:hypothetical protein
MTPDEAESALQAWATVQRDELVQAAHQAGVTKNRIHELTGTARTTIDRILEAPMGTTTHALAAYLEKFTSQWPKRDNYNWVLQSPVAGQWNVAEVAGMLIADAEFKALRLGTWLSTPDGQLLASAIEKLAPAPFAEDTQLLIEALQLAAQMQQADARRKILAGVAVGGVIALALGSGSPALRW